MEFTDQIGNKIILSKFPNRIVSLVPSITELLFDLGLDNKIVGITNYCIKPSNKVGSKEKVGGTKKFKIDKIRELKPDLIIGNKEENDKKSIVKLQKDFPVWISDVSTVKEALEMILQIGRLVDKSKQASIIVDKIESSLINLKFSQNYKVAYLIWKDPYMAAGVDTFINDMLNYSGFTNIFASRKRYPQIKIEELKNADIVLLSSEPYNFSDEELMLLESKLNKQVLRIDGEIYSWYGIRMIHAADYINEFRIKLSKIIPE